MQFTKDEPPRHQDSMMAYLVNHPQQTTAKKWRKDLFLQGVVPEEGTNNMLAEDIVPAEPQQHL